MFTEQAVVHASQSLTSLTLNTNTTQSSNQNLTHQSQYQQPKQQQQDKYNFHYSHHHHHSPHHSSSSQQNAQQHHQQHNHNYRRQNKQVHTLPSSLPTSMESSISRRNSIIEHCSCGLTFKIDKNTNNIITSSTSLLTLNTIYNENPTLIDQTNNQGSLTQSQNILQDAKHQQHHRQHQPQQQHQYTNKYINNHHHQHHAHHCHHQQTSSSGGTAATATAPVTIPRYKPSEPPEIHTHEYFSQESQSQDHTTTITNTTASFTSINAFASTPHSHGCRHSHVHAQTDFSYGQR